MILNKKILPKAAKIVFICLVLKLLFAGTVLANGDLTDVFILRDKATAELGEEVVWTVHASGGLAPYKYFYRVYLYPEAAGDGILVATQPWQEDVNNFIFTALAPGKYRLHAFVQDAANTQANRLSSPVAVYAVYSADLLPFYINSVKPDRFHAAEGEEVKWTVEVMGGSDAFSYAYEVYRDYVKIAGDREIFGVEETFSHVVTDAGDYRIRVFVKDEETGIVINMFSDICTVTIFTGELRVVSIIPDAWEINEGFPITWRVFAQGGVGPYSYKYEVFRENEIKSIFTQDSHLGVATFVYTPTDTGNYRVKVTVLDQEGTEDEMKSPPVTITNDDNWWDLFWGFLKNDTWDTAKK